MSLNPAKVAVTGGTGFIGSHLTEALLARGYQVNLLVRNTNKVRLTHPGLHYVPGNLHDDSALCTLVEDAQTVIHCAGRVRGANARDFVYDNVTGTQNIIENCSQNAHKLKKFVFISSLAAREPGLSFYAQSKAQAEQLLRNSAISNWTIIRPPAVYGPRDRELATLFNWMKHGILWVPGNPKQSFSLLHVADLIDLILLESKSPSCGHCLEPDDNHYYNWEIIEEICSVFFNRKIHTLTIPLRALQTVANLNVLLSMLLGYTPMLTPSKIRELTHDNWQSARLNINNSWSAKVDLKKGLGTLYS